MAGRWRDHFTDRAKELGYEARSVFKLSEIQRRTRVIRRGARAVDLGCYPGSWSRYLLTEGVGRLVGVDLKAPEGLKHGTFLVANALEIQASTILDALGGQADLVLSDMAPFTTGNRLGDHVRQLELAQRAFVLATELLAPGGAFVAKVFEGEDAGEWVLSVRSSFTQLRRLKPEATRKQSVEFFVVAEGFRGSAPTGALPG